MVLGSHVVFGAYGFWLPNDPRGSWSEFVGGLELYRHGAATKVSVRHSVAATQHNVKARRQAKTALQRPAVKFSGVQARAVAMGVADYVQRSGAILWAFAVLPDHVHLVIERNRLDVEKLVVQLKSSATRRLIDEGNHPFKDSNTDIARPPKCFARGEWKVFLNSSDDVRRAIRYVENNPVKDGLRPQRWSFVAPYGV